MTLDLERLAALEAAATCAPWHMFASRSGWSIGPSNDDPGEPTVSANFRSDAWLLMELRNAASELIASSRRAVELEAENERLRAYLVEPSGVAQIAAERYRQQHEEGWTPEHDDAHSRGELEWAARAYAAVARFRPSVAFNMRDQVGWPWADEWFKPTDRISNLVKAGALIAAEIDRLQRAATGWSAHTEGRDDG